MDSKISFKADKQSSTDRWDTGLVFGREISKHVSAAVVSLALISTTAQAAIKPESFLNRQCQTKPLLDGVVLVNLDSLSTEEQAQVWISKNSFDGPLSELCALIRAVFTGANTSVSLYSDPEEDWSKLSIEVSSGLGEDYSKKFALEDRLFELIRLKPHLATFVREVIISQD